MPERNEWRHIIDESVLAKIEFIKELERSGAHVICKSVDITCEKQVKAFANELKELGYPPIRSIIHSAGLVDDKVISEMDSESFSKVFATKVYGGYLLDKYFTDVDYFIMFSSVACILTATGQVNYAAANAYLDALSKRRVLDGKTSLSINWGPWAVGMIEKIEVRRVL